jgi:hypothetical protein
MGQLGLGKVRGECEVTPQKCALPAAREVHCGSEFTLWLGRDGVRHDDVIMARQHMYRNRTK